MIKKHGKYYRLDLWLGKKRVRRSLRTDERAVALDRARELERELRVPKPPGLPLDEFIPRYKEWAKQTKSASYRTEAYRIEILKAWLTTAGILTLDAITPWHVEQFRAWVMDKSIGQTDRRVGRATANRYLALLRTMFNKAVDWGMFDGPNPISRVKFYREGKKVRPLTEAEIRAILDAADALAARKHATPLQREAPAIFRLILNTGLRRSEALCLRWTDVGDDALTIRGKGGKVRSVPLNFQARAILAARAREGQFVFDVPGRTSPSLLRRITATISAKAGVPFHVHLLRHAFASRLLASGVDIVTIGDLLGHSAAMTTLLYSHSNPGLMRRAVDTLSGHRQVDSSPESPVSD
jgi:integrase